MRPTRRHFLGQASAIGFSSLLAGRTAFANAEFSGRFKRCLVLWMEGGPSQQDTFDPKPGGSRKSVKTNVAGLRFAETLGGLAGRADELCLIRSVGSREGEHTRAVEMMHTGFSPVPAFPRPALGAMVSSQRHDEGFPRYVTLGGNGFGPSFLGHQNGPFVVGDIEQARNQLGELAERGRALKLLASLNKSYASSVIASNVESRTGQVESVRRLLSTPFSRALDLEKAKASDRERYGQTEFGQRVLAAKRLLQLGVPFVEAQLPGWDTHVDNDNATNRLCRLLEHPWLALMDDLQASGMWDDTLLVWMGEFGRTPTINGTAGRDHFPEVTPVVLAGGNLGGRVIGQTSDDGAQRVGEKHTVGDLMATILTLLGVDIDATYTTDFGAPTTVTDEGTPIAEVMA